MGMLFDINDVQAIRRRVFWRAERDRWFRRPPMYRQLDSSRILETAERLERRIGERFPDSGLRQVAAELVQMVRARQSLLERLDRVNLPLRIGAVATSLALVLGPVA